MSVRNRFFPVRKLFFLITLLTGSPLVSTRKSKVKMKRPVSGHS
jgi:hypothetical protein